MTKRVLIVGIIILNASGLLAQPTGVVGQSSGDASVSKVWVADLGNGSYRNPVLHADYSDPDAVRVGNTFYMTSSSFSNVPGLPLLESRDLVNWTLTGHALPQLVPADAFATPQPGK